ncbi:unnamed protein product [Symbiodinium sp. CCMP2592]|nr:unnamed protein product [Symbiodinium sp. CCMP2592]
MQALYGDDLVSAAELAANFMELNGWTATCRLCHKTPTLDQCRAHINSATHQTRVHYAAADPLAHIPDDQLEFAVVENNVAICRLCGKQMQESHLYSGIHQKRVLLLGVNKFALSLL